MPKNIRGLRRSRIAASPGYILRRSEAAAKGTGAVIFMAQSERFYAIPDLKGCAHIVGIMFRHVTLSFFGWKKAILRNGHLMEWAYQQRF